MRLNWNITACSLFTVMFQKEKINIQCLTEHASRFRTAIVNMPALERPIGLRDFPRGSCGDATLLLGTYLIKMGYSPFDYMLGERGNPTGDDWSSHAWLERDELFVDITSDQFSDGPDKVIVCYNSIWHAGFAGVRQNVADYQIYDQNTVVRLNAAYSRICSRL